MVRIVNSYDFQKPTIIPRAEHDTAHLNHSIIDTFSRQVAYSVSLYSTFLSKACTKLILSNIPK